MTSPDLSPQHDRPPRLRVNTGINESDAHEIVPSNEEPAFFLNTPPPSSPIAQVILQSNSSTDQKGKEFRKVIGLLIHNLKTRKKPPPLFDDFKSATERKDTRTAVSVLQAVRGVVRMRKDEGIAGVARSMQNESNVDDDDEDETDDGRYSTDAAIEHLVQLRDVLVLSAKFGWNILGSRPPGSPSLPPSSPSLEPPSPRSPFRKRRQSLRRSPSREPQHLQHYDLLAQIISILAEIISQDCRFKVRHIRLSKPPNALQSICLDVAQCLIYSQRNDPKIVTEIGLAVIPAFSTFAPEMFPRLLTFFEECLIRPTLKALEASRSTKRASLPKSMKGLGIITPSSVIDSSPTRPSLSINPPAPMVSIKVDEPQDDGLPVRPGWIQWSPASSASPSSFISYNILSTFAPSQGSKIYTFSALIPPLIIGLLSSIQFPSPTTPINTVHRIHRLIHLIADLKPDAYLDFLEIVAYHTERVRWSALAIMTSLWPGALGHAFIGRAFPIVDYEVDLVIRDLSKRQSKWIQDESAYLHEFIPWSFPSAPAPSDGSDSASNHDRFEVCHACAKPIHDFGLLCVMCTCVVHIGCYEPPHSGNVMVIYPLPHDPNIQKFANIRYSYVLPHRRAIKLPAKEVKNHAFRLINLFTLTCCMVCSGPLWGTTKQGVECSQCNQFAHEGCISPESLSHSDLPFCGAPPSASFTISSTLLRKSFHEHYRDILFQEEDELAKRSYEDISICCGVLWTQMEILKGGVGSGSLYIVRDSNAKWFGQDDVVREVREIVERYKDHLESVEGQKSETLEEYDSSAPISRGGEGRNGNDRMSVLFDWSLIAFMTALIKSPRNPSPNAANSAGASNSAQDPFLSVGNEAEFGGAGGRSDSLDSNPAAEASHPFEMVLLSHMRDALGFEFNIFSDAAARHLLTHIHTCKFFHRLDQHHHVFTSSLPNPPQSLPTGHVQKEQNPSQIYCVFPLPLIIDYSTSVETLVSAISVCLEELDIALNEIGFLWLMKRCWPSGLASDYASHRLVGVVVSWIVSEEERLLRIARDYVARGIPLPGVRAPNEMSGGGPWPSTSPNQGVGRSAPQNTASRSGGDYLACRKQLLLRYGIKWLKAVWNQDEELFVMALYDHCTVLAAAGEGGTEGKEEREELMELLDGKEVSDSVLLQRKIMRADRTLKNIVKLSQSGVIFSGFARILGSWLDSVARYGGGDKVANFPSLLRLFAKDDSSRRSFVATSANMPDTICSSSTGMSIDPWSVITSLASEGSEGLGRSLSWLRVLSQSSVDIPLSTFTDINDLCKKGQVGFANIAVLAEAMFCNAWVYSTGRFKLIGLIVELHQRYSGWIAVSFEHPDRLDLIHRFLGFTLAAVLVLHGCAKVHVSSLGLVSPEYVAELVIIKSRTTMRSSTIPIQLKVEAEIVQAISKYIIKGTEKASGFALKFLSTLFTEPSWLAEDAANTYLSSKEHALYQSVWKSFDLMDDTLRVPRMRLLLRLLGTNPSSFVDLLSSTFKQDTQWSLRFEAVDRLFRIILDLNDPEFDLEGRKPSMLPMFNYFFKAIYEDSREEVRLFAETLAQTFLPAHFHTITYCWDEAFQKSTVDEKLKLVNFMVQLLPHFPTWRVLSWGTIISSMQEDVVSNSGNDNGTANSIAAIVPGNVLDDIEPSPLRVALVSLSLHMIGNGIEADTQVLLRMKRHLALVVGFSNAELVPNFNGTHFVRFGRIRNVPHSGYICLRGLVRALDAKSYAILPPTAMGVTGDVDNPSPNPIGAIFVDLALSLVGTVDFRQLPYLPSRALLDALITILYKYDFARRSLQHLQDSLASAVEVTTQVVKMDISYDLRSAAFTAAQAFLKLFPNLVIKILGHQFFTIVYLLVDLKLANDNLMVAQGTSFLEAALVQFARNGLFILLLKYPIMDGFFDVIAHVMRNHAKNQPLIDGQLLKDIILSDTVTKLTERVDQNFSKVLVSVQQFVEVVHFQNYPQGLIQDVASATSSLARLAADPQSAPFNADPWIRTCTIIIQHNKALSRDLIIAMNTLLKAVLLRFEVKREPLEKLFHVVGSLYRREDANVGSFGPPSQVAVTILNTLSDALRGRNRVTPATITAILQVVLAGIKAKAPFLPPNLSATVGADSVYYLQSPLQMESYVEDNMTALLIAAEAVHDATSQNTSFLYQHFVAVNDRAQKGPTPVRVWNTLALAALSSNSSLPSTNLLINLSGFSLSYTKSLAPFSAYVQGLPDTAALDINHALIAAKLWLMLCKKKHQPVGEKSGRYDDDMPILARKEGLVDEEARQEKAVWNELWPPFEEVITATITAIGTDDVTPLALAIWNSFADLVIFLHQLRSVVTLEATVAHNSLIRQLLKLSRNDSASNKLNRALRCVADPPLEITLDSLVSQAKTELLASEKLGSVLEKRKAVPERAEKRHFDRRRDNRVVG